MNYRIIETAAAFPDVLLYRDVDENGMQLVNILAIGRNTAEDNADYHVCDKIVVFFPVK